MNAEKNHQPNERTEQLTALIAGELASAEAEALRAEIERDPELAREYRSLQAAWGLFEQLEPVAVRPELEASVLQAVQARHHSNNNGQPGKRAAVADLRPVAKPASEPSTGGKSALLSVLAPFAAVAAVLMVAVGVFWQAGLFEPRQQDGDMFAATEENAESVPVDPALRNPLGTWVASTPTAPDAANPARALIERTPVAPDELNPSRMVARTPIASDELNPARIRYRTMQGAEAWQPLGDGGLALDRLNAEIAVAPGTVLELTQPESGSTIFVGGGHTGTSVAVVPDPNAGRNDDGSPKRMMLELSETAKLYVDLSAASNDELAVRTPSAYAEVAGSAAEFEYDGASRTTLIAAARGEVNVAGFDPETREVYDAVVREGERATVALLRRPDVQRHLNTSWIAHWARRTEDRLDERVELPVAEGDVARVSTGGAIGSLVSEDPLYRNVPFVLDTVDVHVEIDDHIAETTVTEIFENTTNRTLEGTFYFPLPEDAAITGFAMWVRGERVEGEWQERRRARMIYDEYRYQMLDPALLEWVEGNTFRMKVFPILPGEKKRIEMRFAQRLETHGDKLRYTYPLVSEKLSSNPMRQMRMNVNLRGSAPITDVASRSHQLAVASAEGRAWQGGFEVERYTPSRDFLLEFRLAHEGNRLPSRAHRIGETGYVAGHFTPPLDAVEQAKVEPGRTVFLVDTSGGMNSERYYLQLALLDELIKGLPEDELFTVLAYDYAPRPIFAGTGDEAFVPVTTAQRRVALAALVNEWRFGATNVRAALTHVWSNYIDPLEPTNIVLLGDGIATTGELRGRVLAEELAARAVGDTGQSVAELGATVRLHAVALGNRVDTDYLAALAAPFDGRVLHATSERDPAEIAAEFVRRLRTPLLTDWRIEVDGNERLFDVAPRTWAPTMPGESLAFAARYAEAGTATVRFHARHGEQELSWTRELNLPATAETRAARTFWAMHTVDDLQARLDAGASGEQDLIDRIVEVSTSYGVSSRYTSLLVLEADDEFATWEIEQVEQAVRDLEVSDGEPFVLLSDNQGEIRVQPQGSDAWVPLSRLESRRIPLHARIAVSHGGYATLLLEDGREVPVAQNTNVHGLDLPGAQASWQQWRDALAAEAEDDLDENGNGNGAVPHVELEPLRRDASPEFRQRATQLVRLLDASDGPHVEEQLAAIRAHIAADRPAARREVVAMQQHLSRLLATLESEQEPDADQRSAPEALTELTDALADWVGAADRDELLTWGVLAKLLGERRDVDLANLTRALQLGRSGGGHVEALREELRMSEPPSTAPSRSAVRGADPADESGDSPDGDFARRGADSPEQPRESMPRQDSDAEEEEQSAPQDDRMSDWHARERRRAQGDAAADGEASAEADEVERGMDRLVQPPHVADPNESPQPMRDEAPDAGAPRAPADEEPHRESETAEERAGRGERSYGHGTEVRGSKLIEAHRRHFATLVEQSTAEPESVRSFAAKQLLAQARGGDHGRHSLLPGEVSRITLPSHMIRAYRGRLAQQLRGRTGDIHATTLAAEWLAEVRADGYTPSADCRTLFLLDTSFTMSEPLTSDQRAALAEALAGINPAELAAIRTKFDLARFELAHAVAALEQGERFAIVLVDKHLRMLRPDGSITRLDPEAPQISLWRANGRSGRTVAQALARFAPDHVANLPAAVDLVHASLLMSAEAPAEGRTAVLFTDGYASWSPDSTGYLEDTGLGNGAMLEAYRLRHWDALLESWAERQETLPAFLHTVGVGNHDSEYLQTLAHFSGGRYLDATHGHAGTEKTLAEETPAERVSRMIKRLSREARNVRAWTELVEWAASPMVDDADLAVSTFLAWASVHPSHYEIYELLGEWLLERNQQDAALRAFSTVVEFDASDAEHHRVLGNLYRALGMMEKARDQFRIARSLTSHVAIAWFHEAAAEMSLGNYEAAEDLLYDLLEVVADERFETGWPARYGNVRQRAARELVLLYRLAAHDARQAGDDAAAQRWQQRLASMLEHTDLDEANLAHFATADFVAVLDWDTDGTDVDIWLDREGRQRCYYSEPETDWGGILHEDMMRGFGPEFLSVGELEPATYLLRTHYFANHASDDKRSYAVVRLFAYLGSERQQVHEYIVRLGEVREARQIARIVLNLDGTLHIKDRTDRPGVQANPHDNHGDVGNE